MLNVNLYNSVPAYGFRITLVHNPKGVQQLSEIGVYCTETVKS